MTFAKPALLASLLMLPGLATAESWKQIRSEADFRSMVVGKPMTWSGGEAIVNADGTTRGKIRNRGKYHGNWAWQGRFYCRNLMIQKKETGTMCQTIEISGDQVRFTRDKGKGGTTVARFK